MPTNRNQDFKMNGIVFPGWNTLEVANEAEKKSLDATACFGDSISIYTDTKTFEALVSKKLRCFVLQSGETVEDQKVVIINEYDQRQLDAFHFTGRKIFSKAKKVENKEISIFSGVKVQIVFFEDEFTLVD